MAHHAVGDLEDARHLGQRLRRGGHEDQVVDALALVADLVGEAPAAPHVVAVPAAAVGLHPLAKARDDLLRPRILEVDIEHEQNLVFVHASEFSLPVD